MSAESEVDDAPILAPSSDSQIPVAFEPLSSEIRLTSQDRTRLATIQNKFAQDVASDGNADLDPAVWPQAVASADEDFRAWFGDVAFLAQQLHTMKSGANVSSAR